MDQDQYLIPEELLRAVTAYLATRPYQEVAKAMPALQSLQKYQPQPSGNQ
jgi:hypothetical protein